MKRLTMLVASLAVAASLAGGAGAASEPRKTQWTVTVENLTEAQPLSPPLLVVHTNGVDVWSVGELADPGVAAIAEDANNTLLEMHLAGVHGVLSAETGTGGPIPPGETRVYSVETRGAFDRLTLLTMLVNTNDGFTGLDARRLRRHGASVLADAYDAGSERNNELAAFIPGPCCGNPFVRAPETRPISAHHGILGVGDLDPAAYDWHDPVARITIERM